MKVLEMPEPSGHEYKLDADKITNPEIVRINLLLSSLYLSAFEILKLATIQSVKDFFVYAEELTEEQFKELRTGLTESIAERIRDQHSEQVAKYEVEVGIKFDAPEQYALIPSCTWLQQMGAIDESEVDEVKNIRDHRNKIAHELPYLLISEDFDVDVSLFQRLREVLRKIDLFWTQIDMEIMAHDMSGLESEEIFSSREVVLELITRTVAEYFAETTDEGDKQQYTAHTLSRS